MCPLVQVQWVSPWEFAPCRHIPTLSHWWHFSRATTHLRWLWQPIWAAMLLPQKGERVLRAGTCALGTPQGFQCPAFQMTLRPCQGDEALRCFLNLARWMEPCGESPELLSLLGSKSRVSLRSARTGQTRQSAAPSPALPVPVFVLREMGSDTKKNSSNFSSTY